MGEGGLAELVIFQFPVIAEICSDVVTDGPVVVSAIDGIGKRPALRVALDAGVVSGHGIQGGGVDNVGVDWIFHMLAAGAVAFFAADVPLGHCVS